MAALSTRLFGSDVAREADDGVPLPRSRLKHGRCDSGAGGHSDSLRSPCLPAHRPPALPDRRLVRASHAAPAQDRACRAVGRCGGVRAAAPRRSTMLDRWWFASVTDAPVWSTKVGAQLLLAGWPRSWSRGLVLSARPSIATGAAGTRQRAEPAGAALPPPHGLGPPAGCCIGFAAYLTLRIGGAAMGMWQPWLLFLHGPTVGPHGPRRRLGLGYHLFRLPLLIVVSAWLRQLLLVAGGFALGGLPRQRGAADPARERRSAPRVLPHMACSSPRSRCVQALTYVFVSRPATATERGRGVRRSRLDTRPRGPARRWSCSRRGPRRGGGGAVRTPGPGAGARCAWALRRAGACCTDPAARSCRPRSCSAVARAARRGRARAARTSHTTSRRRAPPTASTPSSRSRVPFTDALAGDPGRARPTTVQRMPLFDEAQLIARCRCCWARPRRGSATSTWTATTSTADCARSWSRPATPTPRTCPSRGGSQKHLVYTHGDGVVAVPADATAPDGRPDVGALADRLQPAAPRSCTSARG